MKKKGVAFFRDRVGSRNQATGKAEGLIQKNDGAVSQDCLAGMRLQPGMGTGGWKQIARKGECLLYTGRRDGQNPMVLNPYGGGVRGGGNIEASAAGVRLGLKIGALFFMTDRPLLLRARRAGTAGGILQDRRPVFAEAPGKAVAQVLPGHKENHQTDKHDNISGHHCLHGANRYPVRGKIATGFCRHDASVMLSVMLMMAS